MSLNPNECPTCASPRIKHVRKDVRRSWRGQEYVVPKPAYWECPDCGEHVYDRDAMRRMEGCSPAHVSKRRAPIKAAAASRANRVA
jgi:YgiT-type zinc finger domain-containing protein